MAESDQDVALAAYREGVDAIVSLARSLPEAAWSRQACGSWTAADVVKHVVAVSGWYDDWLDRAITGESKPPFKADKLSERNEAELIGLKDFSPADATERFRSQALAYAERLPDHWDLPYGFPFGTVTAGMHAWAAASEWHLHAWDIARAADNTHAPANPEPLFQGVGTCMTRARGRLQGWAAQPVVSMLSKRNPWHRLLRESGRTP